MKAGFRHVEVTGEQPPVQLFNVEQIDAEVEAVQVHLPLQDAVEGEGVVRTGRDAQVDRCHAAGLQAGRCSRSTATR